MAVNLLKKRPLTLAAMLLLAGQAQATELLNSSYDVSRERLPPLTRRLSNNGRRITAAIS